MKNFIKGILPETVFLLAVLVELLGKGILYVSSMIVSISVNLHIVLQTEKGLKYLEIKNKIREATQQMMNLLIAKHNGQDVSRENSKLADLVKPKQPSNVVTLGKKKDEPTES